MVILWLWLWLAVLIARILRLLCPCLFGSDHAVILCYGCHLLPHPGSDDSKDVGGDSQRPVLRGLKGVPTLNIY